MASSAWVVCSVLLFVALVRCSAPPQEFPLVNFRPIIGVLTQPTTFSFTKLGKAYLLADYVKWLESGGARVVAVPYDASEAELEFLFSSLNGFVITGGELNLAPDQQYWKTGAWFYNKSLEAYRNGDYFPVWGTCQGFQLLSMIAAQDPSVLLVAQYDSENISLPLQFLPAAKTSRMFGGLSPKLWRTFSQDNVTMNLHQNGVLPSTFQTNAHLAQWFTVLSTNVDRQGRPFVSSFEHNHAPVYGVQWHPERVQYEWSRAEALDKQPIAMEAMEAIANFLVTETRRSSHTFPSDKVETDYLIYNTPPVFTGKLEGSDSLEAYIW
mmetsp:Transcript_10068/g.25158  ORF Transcript_10068/g.25158 Transcript_10068/m.25158 type:complete len:324 (-) Transcript_10068:459-1430(-)|eukprot:CAMPEP_0177663534 /NCGR_PEP_ID=MMETSP0447-20121125/19969_1 /TAXON_ID=0 /ORGANISM="Stygamoeba regulata, Strain BSH-02190019" /LENGTH=323 /DNA_ID=CAMNT_0019169361 /DNA_START=69 /DNA_END=1040 /DNA_ORIENTATION=+